MKNYKLSGLTLTPLAIIIAVAAVVLGVELLFMVLLHEILTPMFKLPGIIWGLIDAVMLAAAVAPLLYFLVFRRIQESEEHFRQINAAALDAIVIVNEQTLITGWNPAAQKMFQYSPEEAVGRQMHQLIAPPRFHTDAARGFAHFEETGGGPLIGKTTEIAALRKDGSEFPVELSISAVKLKNRWHAIGVIRDITVRKTAEEALRTHWIELETQNEELRRTQIELDVSQTHYTNLYDFAPVGYCTVADEAGLILQANLTAAAMLGVARGALTKQKIAHFILPEDQDIYYLFYKKLFKLDEPQSCEIRMVKNDGTQLWVSLSATTTHDEDGVSVAQVALSDVTERKQTEAAFTTLVGTAAANIGAAFFRETVRSLSAWLGVECVIIGELVNGNRVRALAMQLDGKAIEHYEYALPGTPCNNVTSKGYCEYPEAVCQLFPSDKDLQDMGAEAYIGTPIRDKNGETLGILCAISRHKIVSSPITKGVFEVIAARAGAEIERQRAEKLLRSSEVRLHTVVESLTEGLAVSDLDGQLLHFNRAALDLHGFTTLDECRQHLSKFADTFELSAMDGTVLALEQWPLARVLRGESLRDLEVYVRHLQAGWKRIYSYGGTLVRDDGQPLMAVLSISDITERKQAEAKLAEQVDDLRRWHDATIGREMRVLELKHEVNELLVQTGQPPRYHNAESDNQQEK